MSNAADRVMAFALDHLKDEPVARRISLYRDLAEILASEKQAAKLRDLADELEDIERKAGQLRLGLDTEEGAP